ncbi:hypothetical protein JMA_38080 (plasmid) [Jeotgalibacillus malaysiensis]|uniref:Uncharacterized protein n=1 Tax=Jeotgalibacillus malaysiensis TaxID=1508404 RepID=A0A0B5ASM5_9BACL|nr:hypothetical protein [Jeotgalibacillus malaysiensis]AJD93126.1 hypothetical protein JMA_38080 [Jeotgalibacillus malaysiensis]
MANTNDKRILDLRAKIEQKKREIGKKERFAPLTNCQIEVDGNRINLHTLNRKQAIALLVKLHSLLNSAKKLGFEEEYELSGFKVADFVEDLQTKIRLLDKDIEQKKLDALEKQLHKLLSDDKKVELELDAIEGLLS